MRRRLRKKLFNREMKKLKHQAWLAGLSKPASLADWQMERLIGEVRRLEMVFGMNRVPYFLEGSKLGAVRKVVVWKPLCPGPTTGQMHVFKTEDDMQQFQTSHLAPVPPKDMDRAAGLVRNEQSEWIYERSEVHQS